MTILPDLASLARRSGATISIGATFRSATILDAGDQAQLSEMKIQASIAEELRREGCSVIVEGPGHATPVAIKSLAEAMLQAKCPIMPLGPIPTDRAIGQDHISSAIGATLLGIAGAAHILAAVTREEHTGGVPNIASTIEAIEAARIAAQVIDIHRFGPSALDEYVANSRSTQRTCVFGKETKGCSRCGKTCPL